MKRRLNKKGKVLVTALIIILTVVIYNLVAVTDTFSSGSIIAQAGLLLSSMWLYFGWFGAIALTWSE